MSYFVNPKTAEEIRQRTAGQSEPIALMLWSGGAYFKNPDKVAGYTTTAPARWGEKLFVRGDMDDVAEILPDVVAPQDNWLVEPLTPHPAHVKTKDLVAEAIRATREADNNPPPVRGVDMFTFDDVRSRWNKDITDDEYRIWCHYQTGRMFSPMMVNSPDNGWHQYAGKLTDAEMLAYFDRGLVGYDGKEWLPASMFFSGDIYERMNELVEHRDSVVRMVGPDRYEQQMRRVREATPQQLRLSDTKSERLMIKLFDPFIKRFTLSSFVTGRVFDEPISLLRGFLYWIQSLPKSKFVHGSNYYDITEYYINNASFPKDTDEKVKQDTLRKAQRDCNELWGEYLADIITSETQQMIEVSWNREFNRWAQRPFNSIPLGFEMNKYFGTGDLKPSDALWEGVRFLNAVGSGCVAYDVGVGKTMTAILAMAQAMYSGQCRRPVVVVPNPTYYKWIAECVGQYDENGNCISHGILPHFRDRVNDYYNLRGEYLINMMQRPPQDYTITFLTFEALDEIGMTDKFAETVGRQLLDIMDGSRTAREYQKVREDVDALLGEMNSETVVAIDDLGFDYIVLDEAHNMKKLFTNVRAADDKEAEDDKGRYQMNTGKPSKQAVKTFMVTQYINSISRGRNVVLLTATPFTNNPLEIFSMLVLVAYEKLRQNGIVNIRAFFDLFVAETTEYVVTASNRIELKSVVKGFDNRTTLQGLVFGSMIHKTGEEAKVVRPTKVEYPRLKGPDGVPLDEDMQVDTALQPTPVQREWMREIAKLALGEANRVESLLPRHYFDPKTGRVYASALLAVSLGRQCILSPYLMRAKRTKDMPGQQRIVEDDDIEGEGDDESGNYIYFLNKPNPTAEELFESSPKLQYTLGCIKTIKAHHESRNEEMSGVVIYLDGATEFHRPIMDYMAEQLGLSNTQVAVINGKTSKKTKENIKERFLAGKVKVLMGSSTIKEGIDLQIRSTTLFNLTLPFNPTDLQQLHGRIWRQKNQHSFVRIATPLVEDSVDIFLFQKLDEKTARINTIWYRAGRVNVLNVDDFNPEELKFALMTDPEQRAKIEIENATAELKHKHTVLTENIKNLNEAAETIRMFNEVQVQVDQWHREAREWMELDVMQVRARLKANDYTRKDVLERDENRERRIDSILDADNDPENQPKASYAVIKFHANNDLGEYGEAKGRLIERKEEVDRQLKRTDQLTRLQKNVLNQYNVTVVDDLQPVMNDMDKELAVVNDRLKELQSEEYKNEVVARLKQEREESVNRSRPVEYRVQQFTTHNHLLSCLKDVHDCSIDEQVVRIKKGAVVQLPTMTEANTKDADKERKRKRMVMMAKAAAARARALEIDITESIAA